MPGSVVSTLTSEFAQAYLEAALAGCDMRLAANAIETIRDILREKAEIIAISDVFDDQIGRADLDRLMPALLQLRNSFEREYFERERDRLLSIYAQEADLHWSAWLQTYAAALGGKYVRTKFAAFLAREALRSSGLIGWTADRIARASEQMLQGRWPEAYDWLIALGECADLSKQFRARCLAFASMVETGSFQQPTRGLALAERARALCSSELAVMSADGEYLKAIGDLDRAREHYQRMLSEGQEVSAAYCGLAECREKLGDLPGAETSYGQAILSDPGNTSGYNGLVMLSLRPERYEKDSGPIALLVRRIEALSDFPASAHADIGIAHREHGRFAEARASLTTALDMKTNYPVPGVWLGFLELEEHANAEGEEKAASLGRAEEHFRRFMREAPQSVLGYWGIMRVFRARGETEKSLEWCDRSFESHSEWQSMIRGARGGLLLELGRMDEAESEYRRSLELEPVNSNAVSGIWDVAVAFRKAGQELRGRELLGVWKKFAQGDSVYLYFNEIGNWSYELGDYPTAADCYRESRNLKPDSAVVNSNLALALEKQRDPAIVEFAYAEAMEALGEAIRLDPQTEYKNRYENVRVTRAFISNYGPQALSFDSGVVPIRIEAGSSALEWVLDTSKTNLSPEMRAAIEAMRARVKQKYGVRLPGVLFSTYTEGPSDGFRISLMGQYVDSGTILGSSFLPNESGKSRNGGAAHEQTGRWLLDEAREEGQEIWSVPEYFMHRLEQVVQDRLAIFAGHDEAALLLREAGSDEARRLADDMPSLTRFVQVLRRRLENRESIAEIGGLLNGWTMQPGPAEALWEEFSAEDFPALRLEAGYFNGPEEPLLIRKWLEIQQLFYSMFGVFLPSISVQRSDAARLKSGRLFLNEIALSEDPEELAGGNSEDAVLRLRKYAADLVTPGVVRFALTTVATSAPLLVRATQRQLSLSKICMALQDRLRRGYAVRDLATILEDLLGSLPASESIVLSRAPEAAS